VGVKNHKILVTGASGFVGSAIVDELQKASHYEVFGMVGGRKAPDAVEPSVRKIFVTDISVYETLKEAEDLKKIDTLIHAAGLAHQFGRVGQEDFWKVNVQGTENICRLAQKTAVGHLILISSVAVYGNHGLAEIEETFKCRPAGFYAESKLEAENRAGEFCKKNGLRLTILRLATVIGEGDRGNTARLITTVDKRRFIWVGSGGNKKSLIYKRDVAKGVLKIIETAEPPKKAGPEIYNLTAEAVAMKEIVGTIAENLQKKAPRLKIPENLVRGLFRLLKLVPVSERLKKIETTFEKWLSDDIFSGKKFNETFNFRLETPLSEALARQVKYYLNQKNKSFKN
jgi:nucleoside-diphosphate-sugar epimerase